jgi:methylitaconate Delta-isomerase
MRGRPTGMEMEDRVRCRIIRGGTTKGVFFDERDLPLDPAARDRVILAAFGSPDPRQIDGLGGADPLTSKVALLRPSPHLGADVDYTCGQVGIGAARIDYSLNCGNLAAGVALFAIDEGLVPLCEPQTVVRIFNPPTRSLVLATVATDGDLAGGGAEPSGAPVELRFPCAAGAATGALLPTGRVVDRLDLGDGKRLNASIVDTGNLYALVAAADLGLRGDEDPGELERDLDLVAAAKAILRRGSLIVRSGSSVEADCTVKRLAVVSRAADAAGSTVLTGRILTAEGRAHKAFAVTGAIATAFAAFVEGSIVREMLAGAPEPLVRISHPEGMIAVGVECEPHDGRRLPATAIIWRTARCLLDGWVHIPRRLLEDARREPSSPPPPLPRHRRDRTARRPVRQFDAGPAGCRGSAPALSFPGIAPRVKKRRPS